MAGKLGTKVTQKWFRSWSNEYDRTLGRISYHRELLDLVVKSSAVKRNDKVLDIGCGTGLLSLRFLQAADCLVTAVDNSKDMMALFRDKIKKLKIEKRISCKIMDAGSLKLPAGSFDIIASTLTLHHLKRKLIPLKTMRRILKPGGRLLIGDIDMDTTGTHTDVNRFKRIINVLEQEWLGAFEIKDMRVFERMFDNSKRHILNRGEFCVSLKQWAALCKKAGFRKVTVKKVPRHPSFGVIIADK